MTALDRAKRFIRQGASATALVIVPLAAAVPANASTITFQAATATATATATGATPGGGTGNFTQLVNGGVLFGSATDYTFDIATPSSGSSAASVKLTLSGDGDNGLLSMTSLMASYDYAFTTSTGSLFNGFGSYIEFYFNGSLVGSSASASLAASGPLTLTGWAPTDTLSFWEVVIGASVDTTTGGTVSLAVPFVQITPPGMPPPMVPEPGTAILLGSGLAVGFVVRRRRHS